MSSAAEGTEKIRTMKKKLKNIYLVFGDLLEAGGCEQLGVSRLLRRGIYLLKTSGSQNRSPLRIPLGITHPDPNTAFQGREQFFALLL